MDDQIEWMATAIYTGNRRDDLINKGALIRKSTTPDRVLAQFNAAFLPEAFGWHEFDRSEFVNVVKLGDVDE